MIKKIIYWFRSLKKIPTIEKAKEMKLTHYTNVHGDGINRMNCRSLWTDEFGNEYRCSQLFEGGKDIVMEQFKQEHPAFYKKIMTEYSEVKTN